MVGRASSPSKNRMDKSRALALTKSTETSCKRISNRLETLSPSEAWHTGTNIQTAMRHEPKLTFSTLVALLMDAVAYLDMNKTLRNEEDFIHAVKHLSDQFPVMKLEEWKVICDRLKTGHYGKLYERLKLPELVDIFKQYEGERAERRDEQFSQDKQTQRYPDWQTEVYKRLADDLDLPHASTNKKGRWSFIQYPNDKTDGDQTSEDNQEAG